MKLGDDLKKFETRIGYHFSEPAFLVRALTHSSMSSATRSDNQRLEFLGDRVLGLVMAEALFLADGSATEGKLAPRFNAMVRKETCGEIAVEIGLGDVLKLGRSEMISGGRRKLALLADATEAVIAAVYLDGGFDAARDLVLRLWGKRVALAENISSDAKTALQEWAQARGQQPPTYTEISRDGPDHAPVFTIEVRMDDGSAKTARAATKRAAEQTAAKDILKELEKSDG